MTLTEHRLATFNSTYFNFFCQLYIGHPLQRLTGQNGQVIILTTNSGPQLMHQTGSKVQQKNELHFPSSMTQGLLNQLSLCLPRPGPPNLLLGQGNNTQ